MLLGQVAREKSAGRITCEAFAAEFNAKIKLAFDGNADMEGQEANVKNLKGHCCLQNVLHESAHTSL